MLSKSFYGKLRPAYQRTVDIYQQELNKLGKPVLAEVPADCPDLHKNPYKIPKSFEWVSSRFRK